MKEKKMSRTNKDREKRKNDRPSSSSEVHRDIEQERLKDDEKDKKMRQSVK